MGSRALARKELFGRRGGRGPLGDIRQPRCARRFRLTRVDAIRWAHLRRECRQAYPVPARLKLGKKQPYQVSFHQVWDS